MANLNIRRDVDDTFYRYKMPPVQCKFEGKGNGIKTVIPNMPEIAKALGRDPIWIMKFFGFELGAQTKFDAPTERYIVNGAHDTVKLQDLLDVFIRKFLLCKSCKNPETIISLSKDGRIVADCKACGVNFEIEKNHRLTIYIVRNPPNNRKGSKKGGKSKKSDQNSQDGDSVTNGANEDEDDDDDELHQKIKAEAAEIKIDNEVSEANHDDWTLDTSEAATKARQAELLIKNLRLDSEEDDEDEDSPYGQLAEWIDENKKASNVDIFKKIKDLGIEKRSSTMHTLIEKLFDEDAVNQIEERAPIFVKLAVTRKHQKAILAGVEKLVGVLYPSLLRSTSKILMEFYQHDLIKEEMINKWYEVKSKKYINKEAGKKVRLAAKPFIQWLEQAESHHESESEEEDDE